MSTEIKTEVKVGGSSDQPADRSIDRAMERKTFLLVLLFSFLIFFAQTRSFLLLFDGMTYSALAKHILTTGNWKTLHYGMEQYPEFYAHPPLAIWMQALIYKCFGSAEYIARILPSSFGVLCVLAVFIFTRARYGLTAGFVAAITLLSSTRFIKWGSNFYLDGILSFFCFSSLALWLSVLSVRAEKYSNVKKLGLSGVAGLLLSCAFMTKGILATPILALCLFSALFFLSMSTLASLVVFLLGVVLPIALWIQLGDGLAYLHEYLPMSVGGRVQTQALNPHPWRNILLLWWPWWPIYFYALFVSIKAFFKKDPLPLVLGLAALAFPIGFTLGAGYMEHYITPFYPFAAVLVGIQLSRWLPPLNEKAISIGFSLLLGAALFLATVAPNVNEQKVTTPALWIQELKTLPAESQASIKQIAFTKKGGDLWYSLAVILGRTDWQAIGDFALDRPALAHTILISEKSETVSPTWNKLECMYVPGYVFYAPADEKYCK